MDNLFLVASRSKFRFNTASGTITTEDLWDLPLSSGKANLDDIAKALNKQLKDASEEQSFVKPAAAKTTETKPSLNWFFSLSKPRWKSAMRLRPVPIKKPTSRKLWLSSRGRKMRLWRVSRQKSCKRF
jgi:hypothetical protein